MVCNDTTFHWCSVSVKSAIDVAQNHPLWRLMSMLCIAPNRLMSIWRYALLVVHVRFEWMNEWDLTWICRSLVIWKLNRVKQDLNAQDRDFLPARHYASAGLCDSNVSICLSVRLSRAGIVSKRRKLASWFLHHLVAPWFYFSDAKFHPDILSGSPRAGASNKGGVGKFNHFLALSIWALRLHACLLSFAISKCCL